jgi:glycosyltransferase involved in cell wall biosynthesis
MRISVITAVFNAENTIADAIDSLQGQSYSDFEHIIIDGASTDNTLSIINKKLDDRSTLISEPDNGVYDALNKGIDQCSGDVVGFLHSDDTFESPYVLSMIASFFANPEVSAVYGDLVYVSNDDVKQVMRYWKAGPYDCKALSRGWMPPHPTFYVRRSVYERLGMFNTAYRIAADYDSILRFLAVEKIHTVYIPKVLIRMRIGGLSNRSFKTIFLKSCEDLKILQRNSVGGVFALLNKNLSKLSQFIIR